MDKTTAYPGAPTISEWGYKHDLSKRTLLKAIYSQIWNQNVAYYFGFSSVSGVETDVSPQGLALGLHHSFSA